MKRTSHVVALNRLSTTGYELILERNGLDFAPGQLINLHGLDPLDSRSYSLASGVHDEHLTLLFRHIPDGVLTPQLVVLQPGDAVTFSGPYGEFILRDPARPLYFFATGTGIAPARCYLRSYPGLDLTVIHGARLVEDLHFRREFEDGAVAYFPCVTGSEPLPPGITAGRVTGPAQTMPLHEQAHFYLCGANEMIYEMMDLLAARGVPADNLFTEPYYYREAT